MPDLFQLETDRCQLTWGRRKTSAPPAAESGPGVAARVSVHSARGAIRAVWWPSESSAPIPLDGIGPRLFEQIDYTLFIQSKSDVRVGVHHRDPSLLRDVRAGPEGRTSIGIINFGSQIGRSRFWVDVAGTREFEFDVEVFPTKLDYENDYARMVAEVQEILTGLALEYLRSTFQQGSAVRVAKPSDVEWLTLLKSGVARLEESFAYIARHPARTFVNEAREIRADRIHAGNSSVRRAISRGSGSGNLRNTTSGRVIHEYLPTQTPWLTLDTPEHRWLANQLRTIRRRLVRLRRGVAGGGRGGEETQRTRQIQRELDDLYARLGRLEKLEPMQLPERQLPSSFASLRLLGAPGYREAYTACIALSLGLRVTGGPLELSTKDLSELYEYWCYLSLLRMLRNELGEPINLRELIRQDGSALRVQLKKGQSTRLSFRASDRKVSVSYNPEYSGSHLLIAQTPDMLVTIEDEGWPPLMLVVDAKYRVNNDLQYLKRFDSPGPPEDALNVMHRYRDALLEFDGNQQPPHLKRTVVQGAAMFPYVEPTFGAFGEGRLWKSLQSLGVGAIPMLPGHTEYAEAWLKAALSRGGWGLSDLSISHRSSDRASGWRQAAREPALVTTAAANQLGDDRTLRIAVAPDRPEQFDVKWVGLATGDEHSWTLREIAPVLGVSAGSGPYGLHLTYELGPSKFRNEVRANPSGDVQVSLPLWTSKLALDRARGPEELLLRLEAEWRLLEDLRALGVDVVFEPVHGGSDQHAWLLTPNQDRVTFAGPGGYTIRQSDGSDFVFARLEDVLNRLAAKPNLY